jgi:hypothetical protein
MVTSLECFRRSTYRATKLRALSRTESLTDRLNKRYERHGMTLRRYRTQEVAGSSPGHAPVSADHAFRQSVMVRVRSSSSSCLSGRRSESVAERTRSHASTSPRNGHARSLARPTRLVRSHRRHICNALNCSNRPQGHPRSSLRIRTVVQPSAARSAVIGRKRSVTRKFLPCWVVRGTTTPGACRLSPLKNQPLLARATIRSRPVESLTARTALFAPR